MFKSIFFSYTKNCSLKGKDLPLLTILILDLGAKKNYSAQKSDIYVSARKSYGGDLDFFSCHYFELQMDFFLEWQP